VEKLLERLEKRVRGALARIDELGQENEALKLQINELTTENVRLSSELLDKDNEFDEIEELRSRLEDSQARQELVRLRLNSIIDELDTALGIEETTDESDVSEVEEASVNEPEVEEEESVSSSDEPFSNDSPPTSPPPIQPITEVEWGADKEDSAESAIADQEDDAQTEMTKPKDSDPAEAQEEASPELKDDANPLGLFGGVLDRKTDADVD